MTTLTRTLHRPAKLADPNNLPLPGLTGTLAAIHDRTMSIRTALVGIDGLADVLARRPRLEFSGDTLEYLLERRDEIADHLAHIALLYAQAVGQDETKLAILRQSLDLEPEETRHE